MTESQKIECLIVAVVWTVIVWSMTVYVYDLLYQSCMEKCLQTNDILKCEFSVCHFMPNESNIHKPQ